MTIPHMHALPKPTHPARSGLPWTSDDYTTLVRLVREGRDLGEICAELERGESAVLDRTRRMLPLEEHGGPRDHSIARLRMHLEKDPDYDWSTQMCAKPPPPVYVPPIIKGIGGLADDDVVAVACLLADRPYAAPTSLHRRVFREVRTRGLRRTLEARWIQGAQENLERVIDTDYDCYYGHPDYPPAYERDWPASYATPEPDYPW